MPILVETATRDWLRLAIAWRREHPGDPLSLTVAERRASLGARAAYFWAVKARSTQDPELPVPVGCDLCGEHTYSWCEGCYSRCGSSGKYSGLCTLCDQEKRVCYACFELEIDYTKGHRAFLAQEAKEKETATEVQVTGAFASGGGFSVVEPTQWCSIDKIAAACGRSSEEVLEDAQPFRNCWLGSQRPLQGS